jgi:hypothetical protein
MAGDNNSHGDKITLAQQIFGKVTGVSWPPVERSEVPEFDGPEDASAVAPLAAAVSADLRSDDPKSEPIEGIGQRRELKTAAELAGIIERELARFPDCPKHGLRVTVYGGSHWRAMLTITPAAGAVRNPMEWRHLTEDLAERLRERYDLTWG